MSAHGAAAATGHFDMLKGRHRCTPGFVRRQHTQDAAVSEYFRCAMNGVRAGSRALFAAAEPDVPAIDLSGREALLALRSIAARLVTAHIDRSGVPVSI